MAPKSAAVLSHSLFYNDTLLTLILDGNVLGKVGAQALVASMQRSNKVVNNLKISFQNCDCQKEVDDLFDPSSPGGHYSVNMAEPYGAMVLEECLFLANHRAGCSIQKLVHDGYQTELSREVLTTGNKFDLEKFQHKIKQISAELIKKNSKIRGTVSKLFAELLSMFNFTVEDKLRVSILKKMRERYLDSRTLSTQNVADIHSSFDSLSTLDSGSVKNSFIIHETTDIDPLSLSGKMAFDAITLESKGTPPSGSTPLNNSSHHSNYHRPSLIHNIHDEKDELQDIFLFEMFSALFIVSDEDGSGDINFNEFLHCLASLGIHDISSDTAKLLMADSDIDGSGCIDVDEFSMIMVNSFCKTDQPKGKVVDKYTKQPIRIPKSGIVSIDMLYESEIPSRYNIGNDSGLNEVIRYVRYILTTLN